MDVVINTCSKVSKICISTNELCNSFRSSTLCSTKSIATNRGHMKREITLSFRWLREVVSFSGSKEQRLSSPFTNDGNNDKQRHNLGKLRFHFSFRNLDEVRRTKNFRKAKQTSSISSSQREKFITETDCSSKVSSVSVTKWWISSTNKTKITLKILVGKR